MSPRILHTAILFLLLADPVWAAKLKGTWQTPFGTIKIKQTGADVRATVVRPIRGCKLKKKSVALKGVMLEDNLSGQITVCQVGPGCLPTAKAFVIMLMAKNGRRLSGALHLPNKQCKVPGMGKGRGLRIVKAKRRPKKPKPRKGQPGSQNKSSSFNDLTAPEWIESGAEVHVPETAKNWKAMMIEGFQLMAKGQVEDGRERFIKATKIDPSRAEGYNGVGVTFWARQQYTDALGWYKKALETNPDFGDSFYNMACIYSLENKSELALRYLKIAVLNGYIQQNNPEQILEDPDFANIRQNPEFVDLLGELGLEPVKASSASTEHQVETPASGQTDHAPETSGTTTHDPAMP